MKNKLKVHLKTAQMRVISVALLLNYKSYIRNASSKSETGLVKSVGSARQRYSDAVLPPCEATSHCMQRRGKRPALVYLALCTAVSNPQIFTTSMDLWGFIIILNFKPNLGFKVIMGKCQSLGHSGSGRLGPGLLRTDTDILSIKHSKSQRMQPFPIFIAAVHSICSLWFVWPKQTLSFCFHYFFFCPSFTVGVGLLVWVQFLIHIGSGRWIWSSCSPPLFHFKLKLLFQITKSPHGYFKWTNTLGTRW